MSSQNVSSYNFEQFDNSAYAAQSPSDLLAAAWAEAEAIRERARADGEAIGYAAGIERAEAEFKATSDALVRALTEAASALAGSRAELVEQLTHQAADISLAVATQMVASAHDFKPELVIDVTRAAIRRLAERHRLTVLVNPDDLERVSSSVELLRGEMGGIEYMDVQADRRVEGGAAIIQTEYGEIDATIATQIENARKILAAGLIGDTGFSGDEQAGDDAV